MRTNGSIKELRSVFCLTSIKQLYQFRFFFILRFHYEKRLHTKSGKPRHTKFNCTYKNTPLVHVDLNSVKENTTLLLFI